MDQKPIRLIVVPAEAAADRVVQVTQAAGRAGEHAAPHVGAGAQQRDAETVDAKCLIRWDPLRSTVATAIHSDPAKCALPRLFQSFHSHFGLTRVYGETSFSSPNLLHPSTLCTSRGPLS